MSLLDLMASLRVAQPNWELQLISSAPGSLETKARALGVRSSVVLFPRSLARMGDAWLSVETGQRSALASGIVALFKASPAIATYLRSLRRAVNSLTPDLIHTNGFKMHILGIWANSRNVPLVWHVRDYVRTRKVMSHLLRMHTRWCSAAITNSRSVADDVRAVCGDKLEVFPVYNAIDLERFTPCGNRLDLDRLSNLESVGNGTVLIGLIGTMARWKGHEVFLRAISRLPRDLHFRAYVIGGPIYLTEGSQRTVEELQKLAEHLGIADRTGFTGYVDEPANAIRALDIVVHASTQPEPFGRSIAESMACGRATVVSEGGGASEIVSPEADVLTHISGDAFSLASAIQRLIVNRPLRQELGVRARSAAERRFHRGRLAEQVGSIYHSLAP
jgi:glycosyltransferase involved in cell wall biosynthesis